MRNHHPLAIPNSSQASWLTLALDSAWLAEERLSWNLTQVNVGTGERGDFQQFGIVHVQSVAPALAEQGLQVNELTAGKPKVWPRHISPLTLHPILVPLRSAGVELDEKWKQTGIILMETCFAGFFHLTLPDVVQRAEIQ